jgi:hypothetical protein
VIPAGGLSPDGKQWIHPRYSAFFLPVNVLSRVFRGKFVAALKRAFRAGKLVFPGGLQFLASKGAFAALLRALFRRDWFVYAKAPFGGPEHVLHYLARYTHRVAISNHRLLGLADGQVTFRWKDYAHGSKQRKMTVSAQEFLRRFMLHVLPKGFVRIRFFGFLANRRRSTLLAQCQRLLAPQPEARPRPPQAQAMVSAWLCPLCGGTMVVVERLTAQQVAVRTVGLQGYVDTS